MRDLQVIQHLNGGMNGIEAWRILGILYTSFYSSMEKNPAPIAEMATST